MPRSIKLIAALDDNNGLAKDGVIPWDLPSDRSYFREHIKNGPVVMGFKTYESNNFRPFGNGQNFVLTHQANAVTDATVVTDLDVLLERISGDAWIIGGGQIYKQAIAYADELYLTRVNGDFECDTFFPEFTNEFELAYESTQNIENNQKFVYQVWRRAKPVV